MTDALARLQNHFQSTDTGGDSTDEEEEDSEELGAWKEDLEELENELMSKVQSRVKKQWFHLFFFVRNGWQQKPMLNWLH